MARSGSLANLGARGTVTSSVTRGGGMARDGQRLQACPSVPSQAGIDSSEARTKHEPKLQGFEETRESRGKLFPERSRKCRDAQREAGMGDEAAA